MAGRALFSWRWCLSLAAEAPPAITGELLSVPLIKIIVNEHLLVMAK